MEFDSNKFIKDYRRMCHSFKNCDDCPLSDIQEDCRNIENLTDIMYETQKWAEEHPVKTYLMDFKEKFPNSKVDDIAKRFCLKGYYGESAGLNPRDCKGNCTDCWNREME